MLTHGQSGEELRKVLHMISCHTTTVKKENFKAQDDAESNANSKGDCIPCEYGGNDESVNGGGESVRC